MTKILVSELDRNFKILKEKGDPPPYFLSYEVSETEEDGLVAGDGSIEGESHSHLRLLDTTLRTGSPKFDNYRRVGNDRPRFTSATALALDDNETALRQTVWMATDRVYRGASQRLIQLKANDKLRAAAEDTSDDYSVEKPGSRLPADTHHQVQYRGMDRSPEKAFG